MSKEFRFTLAALIWPGIIDGPLPITFFKVLTPVLIIWIGVVPATFIMGTLASVLVLFFFDTICSEESLKKIDGWIKKLPKTFQKALRVGTITALLPLVLSIGPFPLAVSLRFLNFRDFRARALLVFSSYINSIIWTGIVWGGGINLIRSFFF